eukprot:COSAG01_NODE_6970_length_3411_cov_3.486715_4_plen_148_part_00
MCQYVKIYVPAAVVSASDWWRVAAIGAVALTLGEKDLAVFNSSYRLLWLANIFNGSLSGAAAVKLGIALGAGHARRARALCVISCSLVRHRARPPALPPAEVRLLPNVVRVPRVCRHSSSCEAAASLAADALPMHGRRWRSAAAWPW